MIILPFNGQVSLQKMLHNHAITLNVTVDYIELCIGNSLGVLNIYKDSNLEPWRQCLNLGNIVAITVGDLFNNGEKAMVVISADGHLKGMKVSVYVEKSLI